MRNDDLIKTGHRTFDNTAFATVILLLEPLWVFLMHFMIFCCWSRKSPWNFSIT